MQSIYPTLLAPARACRIIRAAHLGMCFGVRDAIALAQSQSDIAPLTVLGDLVHNETVLAELRERGVQVENQLERVATATVMITAHGTSNKMVQAIRDRGLQALEATCPLVRHAHQAVLSLVRCGFHPVIVGRRDHVEVRGLTGDLAAFDVILTEEDVANLAEQPRFGVIAQTTQPLERVHHLVGLLRCRYPQSEVRFVDTVCQPTKLRQIAAVELARECDVVIVVGGANSNNTLQLAATCRRYCPRVHQVEEASGLLAEWLADAATVGLTAGTSTPDHVVDEVEMALRSLAEGRRLYGGGGL